MLTPLAKAVPAVLDGSKLLSRWCVGGWVDQMGIRLISVQLKAGTGLSLAKKPKNTQHTIPNTRQTSKTCQKIPIKKNRRKNIKKNI